MTTETTSDSIILLYFIHGCDGGAGHQKASDGGARHEKASDGGARHEKASDGGAGHQKASNGGGRHEKTSDSGADSNHEKTDQTLLQMSVGNDPLHQDGYFYQKKDLQPDNRRKSNKKDRQKKNTEITQAEEKMMTVVFIAMLSKNFQKDYNEETKIVILGQAPIFSKWDEGFGEPVTVERNEQKQIFLRCELKVPLKFCNYKCAYKYVLVKSKNKEKSLMYECLVEVESNIALNYGYIDRCLDIPNEYAVQNKIFYKYDGFVYKNLGRDIFVRHEHTIKDREQFFQLHFPLWKGFFDVSYDDKLKAVESLERLHLLHLSQGVPEILTSYEGYSSYKKVDLRKLDLGKIYVQILMQKIKNNLRIMESKDGLQNKVDGLISSTVIVYVFVKYNVQLSHDDVVMVFKCLKIPPDKNLCDKLTESIRNFKEIMSSSFIDNFIKFYEKQMTVIPLVLWLNALPLVHFLRGDCKPFEHVDSTKALDISSWKWWGMKDFPCRNLQGFAEREALEVLENLKKIFEMDPLIKRLFLLLCPLEIYHELLKTGLFTFLELCFTMRKLISDRSLSSGNIIEILVNFLEEMNKTLIHVCNLHKQDTS
ncbi:E3 ubiquitin-protein ligase rnf213-alpha-like [Xenia sp. Carnegie-2017]|uniref:E3 ubiquitin-protein ligase rnf213-alpha-like n=1 Tax=Xenia sp. Carnegie-2017 TaxID=2897299 RepID=UPI001F041587|nr:E3 ubiquitin-protein ligase rnf213-alpha-like [Xenia sp. Carnegie-2017]